MLEELAGQCGCPVAHRRELIVLGKRPAGVGRRPRVPSVSRTAAWGEWTDASGTYAARVAFMPLGSEWGLGRVWSGFAVAACSTIVPAWSSVYTLL